MTTENYVITIGRQFGAGGRELGKLLAQKLGIAYYDKELLTEAAKSAGVGAEFFERADERSPSFISGLLSFNFGASAVPFYSMSTSISDDSIYKAQCDVIHQIADRGPCVIVGRSADHVLRNHPRLVNIFVHAPVEERIKRIMSRQNPECEQLTIAKAQSLAERSDKLRANYYNFYTDKRWGAAPSYDLTIDSSKLPMETIADLIITYLSSRW